MDDFIVVDDDVLVRLGQTRDALRAMTLGQFIEKALSLGYDVDIGPCTKASGGKGHLRIKMAKD